MMVQYYTILRRGLDYHKWPIYSTFAEHLRFIIEFKEQNSCFKLDLLKVNEFRSVYPRRQTDLRQKPRFKGKDYYLDRFYVFIELVWFLC
jgi:hypothetical protein